MLSTAIESDKAVNYAVKSLMSNLDYELFVKDTLKKMPEHTFNSWNRLNNNIVLVANMPKPIYKYESRAKEDQMPSVPPQQMMLTGKVSFHSRSEIQQKSAASNNNKRRIFSRYASTSQKKELKDNIHLDLSQLKENKVIQIPSRFQQNTAKTFRSVIQLDSQIAEMRKTYLKDLRKQAQLKSSMTQQNFYMKKKRIPRDFTFDFSGQILAKRNSITKKTVFSPLKSKSVSAQKVQKKVNYLNGNYEEESSLQQRLQRSKTGSSQRKVREFNNLNQRQVSHIPYISLAQNTKLYENSNKIEGESKSPNLDSTVYSSRKSSFMHYRQKNSVGTNQDPEKDRTAYPKQFKKLNKSFLGEGRIIKNKDLNFDNTDFGLIQRQIPMNDAQEYITNRKAMNP